MSTLSVEARSGFKNPSFASDSELVPLNIFDDLKTSFLYALNINPDISPSLPATWLVKTKTLLNEGYERITSMGKRAIHFFSHLGENFPDCATLESGFNSSFC